ncbi:hypothetical protein COV16_06685 [Candidatus Woesearchaeota archaeon CG10_big_fil_rev_8_21_14_0_10_34_8]|nr:MAG: hypothetical protein COV16_06685 [Candidatus Woesearchaeota archaeon CG10_big_fil_rev_8_21_14_0_10_34_8]
MELLEWTLTFAKHRHMMKGELVKAEQKDSIIHVACKNNKSHDYFVSENLDHLNKLLESASKSDKDSDYNVHLVCYNTKANFKELLNLWQKFITHQRLTVYFVNPDSSTETKWIVKPWLHNRISDPASLETGLKSLFDTVEHV